MLMYQLLILVVVLAKVYSDRYKDQKQLRVVLVGKTGVGKSSLGNVLLNKVAFRAHCGFKSVTEQSTKASAEVEFPGFGRKNLVVVDTPGLFCTRHRNDVTAKEIGRCVEMSFPGPHVFIYVVSGSERFTDEDSNTFNELNVRFGGDVFRHMMVVFTKEHSSEFTKELEEILGKCDNRYAYIISKTPQSQEVDAILKLIVDTVQRNGGSHYTSAMYKAAAKLRRQAEREGKGYCDVITYGVMALGVTAAVATGGVTGIAMGGVSLVTGAVLKTQCGK